MKIFDMIDGEEKRCIGQLLCFVSSNDFIIEIDESMKEYDVPIFLSQFVKKGEYTIDRYYSYLWVKERIIPSGRQNIASILASKKWDNYNENKLLAASRGISSQDSIYLEATKELRDYVISRNKTRVRECVPLDDFRILVFFNNGESRLVYMKDLLDINKVESVMRNKKVYDTCQVAAGGCCITFNNSIDISSSRLYHEGTAIGLTLEDFITFSRKNLLDTTESCKLLNCSRQNLAYMVKRGELNPVKEVKGNLYLKGEVQSAI